VANEGQAVRVISLLDGEPPRIVRSPADGRNQNVWVEGFEAVDEAISHGGLVAVGGGGGSQRGLAGDGTGELYALNTQGAT
jgi:hypothetical protein